MCGVIVLPHPRGRAQTVEAVPASEKPPGPAGRAGELGRQTETPVAGPPAGPGGVSDPLRQTRLLADNPRSTADRRFMARHARWRDRRLGDKTKALLYSNAGLAFSKNLR